MFKNSTAWNVINSTELLYLETDTRLTPNPGCDRLTEAFSTSAQSGAAWLQLGYKSNLNAQGTVEM